MDNKDMNNLIDMLSKMDKKELEDGLAKANEILNSKDGAKIFQNFKNMK